MSRAHQVISRIPQLRRFARALTGSQRSGDAYVAAVLEALVSDPDALPVLSSDTVSLYALFCRLWQTVDLNGNVDPAVPVWQANADSRLAAMMPQERLAFLLSVLEGFSAGETAEILGITTSEAEDLLATAEADIATQLASKVLIIEDEQLVALDLQRLVTEIGHTVSDVAATHQEALEAIGKDRPGLILADVHLADGSSGIEAVHDILEDHSVPVIFITAYPDLLLTGERPEPTFLIAKPYDPNAVKAMISQVLFFETGAGERKVA